MVESFREKEIAAGFFAKNVVLPIEQLSPTFSYQGVVQRFKAKVRTDDDAAATSDDAVQGGGQVAQGGIDVATAAAKITEFLSANQLTAGSVDVAVLGHPNFPEDARIEPFTTAIATGNLEAALAEATS